MTVAELIEKLKTTHQHAEVLLEGDEGGFYPAAGQVTEKDLWGGEPGADARILRREVFIS